MNVTITSSAVEWFKQELGVDKGDAVRFFARYGGHGNVQSGFSLGMEAVMPREVGVSTIAEGITFYIEREDLWYFDEQDLQVDYDKHQDEILFKVG